MSDLVTKISEIQIDIKEIKKYIISTTKKHTDEELEKCYNQIIENLYLTSEFIDNDPVLSIKYSDRMQQKRFFDELMRRYDGLEDIRHGWGKRRYIFKKENEPEVLKILKHKKNIKTIHSKGKEYEGIKSLIINLNKDYFSTSKLHEILRIDCGIKDQNKRGRILRDLKRDRVIRNNPECTGFYIVRMDEK